MDCKVFEVITDEGSAIAIVVDPVPCNCSELGAFIAAGFGRNMSDLIGNFKLAFLHTCNGVPRDWKNGLKTMEPDLINICGREWTKLVSGDTIDIDYELGRREDKRTGVSHGARINLLWEAMLNAKKRAFKDVSYKNRTKGRIFHGKESCKGNQHGG
jgi:hypothetical protein